MAACRSLWPPLAACRSLWPPLAALRPVLAVYSIGGNVKAMRFTYVIDNLPENGIFALVGGKLPRATTRTERRNEKHQQRDCGNEPIN